MQFTVSPIRTSNLSSDPSLERKRKCRKRKSKKFKTQRSKSSGKKRQPQRASSSESEHDDNKSRSVHVRKQQDIYEPFGPPNDNQDSVKATQSASHTPELAAH